VCPAAYDEQARRKHKALDKLQWPESRQRGEAVAWAARLDGKRGQRERTMCHGAFEYSARLRFEEQNTLEERARCVLGGELRSAAARSASRARS
jgi:hypothetical protein